MQDEWSRRRNVTGETVKRVREKWKLSQSAFAGRLGISQPTVSEWEANNHEVSIEIVRHVLVCRSCQKHFLGERPAMKGVPI